MSWFPQVPSLGFQESLTTYFDCTLWHPQTFLTWTGALRSPPFYCLTFIGFWSGQSGQLVSLWLGVLPHSQQSIGGALVLSGENMSPCLLPHYSVSNTSHFSVVHGCGLLSLLAVAQIFSQLPGGSWWPWVGSLHLQNYPTVLPKATLQDVWLPFTSSSSGENYSPNHLLIYASWSPGLTKKEKVR